MPTPVYLICSESGCEDKETGLASVFNIIDRIVAKKRRTGTTEDRDTVLAESLSLRIVAVWRTDEESEFETDFESELRAILLPANQQVTLLADRFRFLREQPKHRITVIVGRFQLEQSGQLVFESRIRRTGDSAWLTQRYIVDVLVQAALGQSQSRQTTDDADSNGGTQGSNRKRKRTRPRA